MLILVGSKNPVKIEATEIAFSKHFDDIEIKGYSVESNVPDQPHNDEVYEGALNRTKELFKLNQQENLDAQYFVGIEGGIEFKYNRWFSFGCMCIMDKDRNIGFGSSPHFQIPPEVIDRLLKREELGHVMDEIMKQKNTKQKMGAIGFFTGGVMNRRDLYVPGLIAALVSFNHPDMFFAK